MAEPARLPIDRTIVFEDDPTMHRSMIAAALSIAAMSGLTGGGFNPPRSSPKPPEHPAHRKRGGYANKANHHNTRERARRTGGEMWQQYKLLDRMHRGLD